MKGVFILVTLAVTWPFLLRALLTDIVLRQWLIHSPETPRHTFAPSAFGLPEPYVYTHHRNWYKAWSFEGPAGSQRVVHFFHGNGAHPWDHLWQLGQLYARCNCSIMAVAYLRGGASERQLDLTISNYLNQFVASGRKQHYLYGVSLGAAAAIKGLQFYGSVIEGIILENPFTSLVDVFPERLKFLEWFVDDKWDSLSIARCRAGLVKKVLVLSSELDEVIPRRQHIYMGDTLGDHTLVNLFNCTHGNAPGHPFYWPAIEAFFQRQ